MSQFRVFQFQVFDFEIFNFQIFDFQIFQFEFRDVDGRERQVAHMQDWQVFMAGEVRSSFFTLRHGDVDVFENLARSDAENAFGGFDQVVALAAAVLTPEVIGEAEGVLEFLGFHQEAGTIGLPFHRSHGAPIQVLGCLLPN